MNVSPELLRTLASVPQETRLLDLGEAYSDRASALQELGFRLTCCLPSIESADNVASELAPHDDSRETFVCAGDAADLPFSPNSFDWVITGARLDYGTPPVLKKQLSECVRVLREGGWIYMMVDVNSPCALGTEGLGDLVEDLDLAVAQQPQRQSEEESFHVIYRHVTTV